MRLSLCTFCKHRAPERPDRCAAYPDGIPRPFRLGLDVHVLPAEGDKGISFEPGDLSDDQELAVNRWADAARRRKQAEGISVSDTIADGYVGKFPTSKLSQLQKNILQALRELAGEPGPDGKRTVAHYDVRRKVHGDGPLTRSASAAWSKALARLEARGLLVRERWFHDGKRVVQTNWSNQLSLTPAGIEATERANG